MNLRRTFYCFIFLSSFTQTFAQDWKPVNGAKDVRKQYTLFEKANIYLGNGEYLEQAEMLIQEDKIIELAKKIEAPANTIRINLDGKFIYPSFIELHSSFGIAKAESGNSGRGPQLDSRKKGPYYWNEAVKAETDALSLIKYDEKEAEKLRKMGFSTLLSHQHDGVIRGNSALLNLNDDKAGSIVLPKAAFHYSFFKGSSKQSYPNSLMGMIALIRQSLYDAKWYEAKAGDLEYNASLEAIVLNQDLPQFFDVESDLSILRAQAIAKEFGKQFIIKGNGKEYKRLEALKACQQQLIVPIDFPKAYDVSDPFDARALKLGAMKEWEFAPFNLAILNQAGIDFAITADGLKSEKEFFKNLEKAIQNGLPRSKAIDALSIVPAKWLKVETSLGSLAKGKKANFLISSDSLFKAKSELLATWVDGKSYEQKSINRIDIRGNYSLVIDKSYHYDMHIKGSWDKPAMTLQVKNEKEKKKAKVAVEGNRVHFNFMGPDENSWELSGLISDSKSRIWSGKMILDGKWVDWAAIKKAGSEDSESKEDSIESDSSETEEEELVKIPDLNYPNAAYGWDSLDLEKKAYVFRNATLWTNEKDGILKGHDLIVYDGKIQGIGYKIDLSILYPELKDYIEIDCQGKHLTTGIIDEHSHIAIDRGVNESGQAVTAEVRIGDVIDPDDINIYRQLAGGVTCSQLLHGSANPIGGQSAIIKLRWGLNPEAMKVKDSSRFIKFALGENVKQSNWGDRNTVRFPQTRMGVEQVFYDAFIRAKEYQAEWTLYNAKSKKEKKKAIAPRFDLELEALKEILDTQRFITCHSYIQSEINMLMHVADSMGFRVNTFTHILEGYKVADKMREHGVAGSTFSDWWAYKYEVNDAIPYNGAIMHQNGVLTGFNSDDAEMGRRLNQEAAKAVKYGGVSEVEAWKFVTLNPAKMLHLDHRMGSLKVGKDADLVIWSANPLSIYAQVEQTYIDGILFYDQERNKALIDKNMAERERLINAMLKQAKKGAKTQKVPKEKKILYECDTLEEEL